MIRSAAGEALDTVDTVARKFVTERRERVVRAIHHVRSDGSAVPWRYDAAATVIEVDCADLSADDDCVLVTVATGPGNETSERISAGATARPVMHSSARPSRTRSILRPASRSPFESPPGHVDVFDLVGRKIAVLADRPFGAGEHSLIWDARDADGRPVSTELPVPHYRRGSFGSRRCCF
jgi:hypothetical protein